MYKLLFDHAHFLLSKGVIFLIPKPIEPEETDCIL